MYNAKVNKETKNFSWLDVAKSVWYFLGEDKTSFTLTASALYIAYFYELVPPYLVGKIVDFFTKYKQEIL